MAEVAEGPVPLLRRGLQHQGGERLLRPGDGQSTVHRVAVHRADLYKPGPHRGPARQDRARGVVFALRRGVVLDCMVGLGPAHSLRRCDGCPRTACVPAVVPWLLG